jgi:uncharacterized protein YbjT (DUF2867 family)
MSSTIPPSSSSPSSLPSSTLLILGTTGTVGYQVLLYALQSQVFNHIRIPVRNPSKLPATLQQYKNLEILKFDETSQSSINDVFKDTTHIFLLVPTPSVASKESPEELLFQRYIQAIQQNLKTIQYLVYMSSIGKFSSYHIISYLTV